MTDPRDEPTTDRHRKPREPGEPRQLTVPVATVAAILCSVISSVGTGGLVSGTQREGQLRLESRLDAVAVEVRRSSETAAAAITRLEADGREREGRLRSLELWRAQVEARASALPR